ncbi:MAG: phosphohydrolase [Candidatus Omnitrophota bacterium]
MTDYWHFRMIEVHCPGKSRQNLTAALYRCPKCGYGVEIFSDEIRRRCPKCRTLVYREKAPSCIDWCPAARECFGETKWKERKKQT